jgi:DNA-binding response OmpR family regulator
MSGYTDDVIGHHGILDAGVEFISKPFHPAVLCARIREILDRGPA